MSEDGHVERAVCAATTYKRKPCRKWAVAGSRFCHLHQDRSSKSLWYDRGLVGILATVIVGWACCRLGPEPEEVHETHVAVKAIGETVPKMGQTLEKVDRRTAETESTEKKVEKKSDESLEILRRMEATQTEQAGDLEREYPLGYVLFTVTGRKEVVPLDSPMDKVLEFDWKSGNYSVRSTLDQILLTLPPCKLNLLSNRPPSTISNYTIALERKNRAQYKIVAFSKVGLGLLATVVAITDPNTIVAVGLVPLRRSVPNPQ